MAFFSCLKSSPMWTITVRSNIAWCSLCFIVCFTWFSLYEICCLYVLGWHWSVCAWAGLQRRHVSVRVLSALKKDNISSSKQWSRYRSPSPLSLTSFIVCLRVQVWVYSPDRALSRTSHSDLRASARVCIKLYAFEWHISSRSQGLVTLSRCLSQFVVLLYFISKVNIYLVSLCSLIYLSGVAAGEHVIGRLVQSEIGWLWISLRQRGGGHFRQGHDVHPLWYEILSGLLQRLKKDLLGVVWVHRACHDELLLRILSLPCAGTSEFMAPEVLCEQGYEPAGSLSI